MREGLADVSGCAAGYVIGSVPVGLLLGRALRGLDVRDYGSHSTGTTNVLRLLGPTAAAATFALDVGKGGAAVLLARRLGAGPGGQAAAGFAAVVGHSFPVFARFRGGKGVATGYGALMAVSGEATVFAMAAGLTALGATRIVSVASLSACAGSVIGAAVRWQRTGDAVPLGFACAASALITLRHSENIRRLLRGEEPRASLRRRPRPDSRAS